MGLLKTLGRMAERTSAAMDDVITFDLDGTTKREVSRQHQAEDAVDSVKALAELVRALKS